MVVRRLIAYLTVSAVLLSNTINHTESTPAVLEQPQPQIIVQDDLRQLLDNLPADLGGLLINHPKRSQLIEVGGCVLLLAVGTGR